MAKAASAPLPTGSVIGVLGGGQLGRMLALAAARLGMRCHVFEPEANCPASQVADHTTTAGYDDLAALLEFARNVDVVTFEFENIPDSALDAFAAEREIRPNRRSLATSQDRLAEKAFLASLGLTVAPYAGVSTMPELQQAVATIGLPLILKTRRFGYDGKGQVRLKVRQDIDSAISLIGAVPSVAEGFVEFERELSVIAARSHQGQIVCFDPGENVHVDGILDTTTVPANVTDAVIDEAKAIARTILDALDYVGVMGVELFVTATGLIVNEIAPRVHNSGHWTQNACAVDQFEQHIRAVIGWPLAGGERHSNAVMKNLIGDDVNDIALTGTAGLHLYGKAEVKPGRKMGHVNRLSKKTP